MAKSPKQVLKKLIKRNQDKLVSHVNTLAAAYFKHTNIPPDQAVMCHRIDKDGVQRFWVEPRTEEDKVSKD